MRGDALASGARSATFTVAPGFKFNEAEMRRDLTLLPKAKFQEKYLVADAEYALLTSGDEAPVNDFAESMKRQAEFYERGLQSDQQQAASLKRECIIEPFVPYGLTGKVIVDRDEPATPQGEKGRLLIPRALRKEKTLLPTTGHIIKSAVYNDAGLFADNWNQGRRVLFGQMSGTAVCMKGYPTWTVLDLAEIIGFVNLEDAVLEEKELEPLV